VALIPLSVIAKTANGYSFFGMKYRFSGVYLVEAERNYVEGSLLSIQRTRNSAVPLSMRFVKTGDSLLFLEFLEKNNFRLIQNMPIVKQRKADIEVYINKRKYNPGWINLINPQRYRETENIRIFFNGSFYNELKGPSCTSAATACEFPATCAITVHRVATVSFSPVIALPLYFSAFESSAVMQVHRLRGIITQ
jgi:hypothetical protein